MSHSYCCSFKFLTSAISFQNIFMKLFQHISSWIIPSDNIRKTSVTTLACSHSNFSGISPNDLSEMTSIETKTRRVVFVTVDLRVPNPHSVSDIIVVRHSADVFPLKLSLFFMRVAQFTISRQLLGPSLRLFWQRRGPFKTGHAVKGAKVVVCF